MKKELDTVAIKADAIAANIMHKDGYIVKDDKGYTFTGAFLSSLLKMVLEQPEGEATVNEVIKLFEAHAKEIKDE